MLSQPFFFLFSLRTQANSVRCLLDILWLWIYRASNRHWLVFSLPKVYMHGNIQIETSTLTGFLVLESWTVALFSQDTWFTCGCMFTRPYRKPVHGSLKYFVCLCVLEKFVFHRTYHAVFHCVCLCCIWRWFFCHFWPLWGS